LPEALSVARRAVGLLAGADMDEVSRQRVQARLRDLELLDRLENVGLETMTAVKDGHFDDEAGDRLFTRIFREADLTLRHSLLTSWRSVSAGPRLPSSWQPCWTTGP
jgi:hypothetical protein